MKMNKKLRVIMIPLCMVFASFLFSQTNESLIREFVRGNIREKTELINLPQDSTENYDDLCVTALEFISTNYSLLSQDSDFIELARTVVQKSSIIQSSVTLPLLQKLFAVSKNLELQMDLLAIFSSIGAENQSIIDLVNTYTLDVFASDDVKKNEKLLFAVSVLDTFGHISSFSALFKCYALSDNEEISKAAGLALDGFVGRYENKIRELITKGNSREKYYTLNLILGNDQNSDFFKAEMSEKSLSNTIYIVEDVSTVDSYTIALQMAAITELQRISWTRSAELVRDYFLVAKQEFELGLLSEEQFAEIIFAFSSLSSLEAGGYLAAYLEELNKLQEENIPYSKPIALAVIQSLGLLGDKIAFDALLYTTYLGYPEDVILAARDALVTLKW